MSFKNSTMTDSIMSEMHSIMQSDSHKALFEKTASFSMQKNANPDFAPANGTQIVPAPAQMPAQAPAAPALNDQLKSVQVAMGQQKSPSQFSADESKLNMYISYYTSNLANSGKPMADGSDYNADEFVSLLQKINPTVAQTLEASNATTAKTQNATTASNSSLVATLVKIADLLADKGFAQSEVLADQLINTIIVEAKNKKMKKLEKKLEKKMSKKDKKKECDDDDDCE